MQPQIVEAGERLTRRYVASGPHYLAMRMGQQHAREPNETMKCWVASYSGPSDRCAGKPAIRARDAAPGDELLDGFDGDK
jgi:hypothetical protein